MGRKIPAIVVPSKHNIPHGLVNRKKILLSATLGLICLVVPVLMIFVDPIFIMAKFKLRFTKGSILHEFMKKETEVTRLEIYVFNLTNAERYLSGEDQKIRVEEVGPFLFQEYRTNENLELDLEAGVVRFVPRFRTEFIEEGSIGRPEDVFIVLPNIPYVTITSFFSPYPYMLRSMYSMWVRTMAPPPTTKLSVDKYLWGYRDKIVDLCETLLPGLVYYNTFGVLDRLYDYDADYVMEMDITESKKFQVRSVRKTRHEKPNWNTKDLVDAKLVFNDTYEGAAFPTEMTPDTHVNLYRPGICKTFSMEYSGRKPIKLGPDAYVYKFSNETFMNTRLCDSKGLCPKGVMDISECFNGLPVALTNTHFLDVDPVFLDRVEGLSPDREKHTSALVIEPKIGLTVETNLAIQLNLLLRDLSFIPDLAKFSDLLMPIAHVKATLPELPTATKNSLKLLYVTGPQILLGLEILSCVLGLLFIGYSLKLACHDWSTRKRHPRFNFENKLRPKVSAELPLIS